MATVIFYEKPGCINNTKQKRWLRDSGHEVIERDLLLHPWEANELIQFFTGLPVTQWFNTSAPRIKSGEISPATLSAEEAIALMLAEPLLIRRPLLKVNGETMVGFDNEVVNGWIGLSQKYTNENLEVCARL